MSFFYLYFQIYRNLQLHYILSFNNTVACSQNVMRRDTFQDAIRRDIFFQDVMRRDTFFQDAMRRDTFFQDAMRRDTFFKDIIIIYFILTSVYTVKIC